MSNERKQTDPNGKDNNDPGSETKRTDRTGAGSKKPLAWDARNLEASLWLRDSPESTKGRYEDRFFEDE